jgi:hypothetical protein
MHNCRTLLVLVSVVSLALPAAGCAAQTDREPDLTGRTTDNEAALTSGDGLTTCGPSHDKSCAAKIPVKISDSKTILLGQYDVTAGRFRQFVGATNGNFKGWVAANQPAWWNGPWRTKLATKTGVGNFWSDVGGYGYDWTVWQPTTTADVGYLVGPWNFGIYAGDMALTGTGGYTGETSGSKPAVDFSMYGPANEGCKVSDYGARTYWQPNGATGGDDNQYPQSALDKKALNCVSFYLLAAFCAWDGGRLATTAELDAAWGAETYPWGTTEPFYANFSGKVIYDGPKDLADYGNAGGAVYEDPPQVGKDQSNHLSIPGDFPKGNGPYGHADLAGLVIGMTGDIAQETAREGRVTVLDAPVVRWHRGGSWQGHGIARVSGYAFIATNKYIAMGGRCAYDAGAPPASSFPLGFHAEYFAGTTLTTSKGVRVDPYVAFTAANFMNPAASTPSTPYSVRWKATLVPRYSETYTFTTQAGDGMRVWVNGTNVIDDWTTHGVETKTGTIALVAGHAVTIQVDHYNAEGSGTSARVLWESASQLPQVVPPSALTPTP